MAYSFVKMHGTGNDFVIIDGWEQDVDFASQQIKRIANRHYGIGCDQVIVLKLAASANADLFMQIFNADGNEIEACGNAARCVGSLLTEPRAVIETLAGLVIVEKIADDLVMVDMGKAVVDSTINLKTSFDLTINPISVQIGNPHLVFFVADLDKINVKEIGPQFENHKLFPNGVNVEVAQIIDKSTINLSTWERGVGKTISCGTGACAAVVAAVANKLVNSNCQVIQEGGNVIIDVGSDLSVKLTGLARLSFRGSFSDDIFK